MIAEAMGCEVMTAYDVGIAAFHRFLDPLKGMLDGGCDAIIVVAGMEGALASVVSSLSDSSDHRRTYIGRIWSRWRRRSRSSFHATKLLTRACRRERR